MVGEHALCVSGVVSHGIIVKARFGALGLGGSPYKSLNQFNSIQCAFAILQLHGML